MYSLFLYDSKHHIDLYSTLELTHHLEKIQFTQWQNNQLIPADLFMQHITFLGCSPNLNNDIDTVISINTHQAQNAIGGDSIVKLSCPNCKSKINNSASLLKNYSSSKVWNSPCCQQSIAIEDINWRKSAGFSQAFIQINNIFPKEAIPSDDFLLKLEQFSQSSWKYFYSKQHIF